MLASVQVSLLAPIQNLRTVPGQGWPRLGFLPSRCFRVPLRGRPRFFLWPTAGGALSRGSRNCGQSLP